MSVCSPGHVSRLRIVIAGTYCRRCDNPPSDTYAHADGDHAGPSRGTYPSLRHCLHDKADGLEVQGYQTGRKLVYSAISALERHSGPVFPKHSRPSAGESPIRRSPLQAELWIPHPLGTDPGSSTRHRRPKAARSGKPAAVTATRIRGSCGVALSTAQAVAGRCGWLTRAMVV